VDPQDVVRNYTQPDLTETVLHALREVVGDLAEVTPDTLAAIDEFHVRGRESTVELVELVGDLSGTQVLDVGCGLGGTARYLATTFDCEVIGVDLTPTYVALARSLSELVGLADRTAFQEGSATELPFEDEAFDVVWMEHVQMNISAKDQLVRELARVLKPGGRLAFHEIFAGANPEPIFPVPWAETPSTSVLTTPDAFRKQATVAGLNVVAWTEVTSVSAEWFRTMVARVAAEGPPPLGIHVLMGSTARVRLENLSRNLSEERVRVVQAVLRKV